MLSFISKGYEMHLAQVHIDFWSCGLDIQRRLFHLTSGQVAFPNLYHCCYIYALLALFPFLVIPITSLSALSILKAISNLSAPGYLWFSLPLLSHCNTSLTDYILPWIIAILYLSQPHCWSVGYLRSDTLGLSEQHISIELHI